MPADTPVRRPEDGTIIAREASPELHVPPDGVAESVAVPVTHTAAEPVTDGTGLIVCTRTDWHPVDVRR